MTVTPTGTGVVRIDGVHLDYRDGLRFGSEDAGIHVVLTSG